MKRIRDFIFNIRFFIIPKEFKEGTWIVNNGNFINVSELWIEKERYWELSFRQLKNTPPPPSQKGKGNP